MVLGHPDVLLRYGIILGPAVGVDEPKLFVAMQTVLIRLPGPV